MQNSRNFKRAGSQEGSLEIRGKNKQTYNNVNPLFLYTYIQVHFEDYSKQKHNISLLIPKGKKESDAKLAIKEFLKYYLMSFG